MPSAPEGEMESTNNRLTLSFHPSFAGESGDWPEAGH